MTEPNKFDLVMQEIVRRGGLMSDFVGEGVKDKRPFDTEKITPKMQLDWFTQNFSPENEVKMRQDFGDEPIDAYIQNINKLMRGK